jgi:AcrR family transcriptional regulator
MVAVTRTQPAEVRREQLLDAAQSVLLRQGLRATTMADVAQAAGLAKGTTYLYFSSKDEVLAALRARYHEHYTAALDVGGASPRERLRRLVVALFAFGDAHHDLHHVLFHEAGFSERDAFVEVRHRVESIVEELGVPDVEVTTSFVLHGVHGALVDAHQRPRKKSSRAEARTVADLVERVVSDARTNDGANA